MATHAVIVGAGTGSRMNRKTPKQYLPLQGMPILSRTVLAFNRCADVDRIILVVPARDVSFCTDRLLSRLRVDKAMRVVAGGRRRQDSVWNGILSIDDRRGIVVIHDGVRPLVRSRLISRCIKGAEERGACVAGIPLQDTLKSVNQNEQIEKTLLRTNLWLAQTPQAFQYKLVREAHAKARRDGFTATDDASLLERMGQPVYVLTGSKFNLKITTEEDLALANAILARKETQL